MKRTLLISAAAILLLAVILVHVRIQPSGRARVIRDGGSVRVVSSRIGWAPPYLGAPCTAGYDEGRLIFDETLEGRTAEGEPFSVQVAFRYGVPSTLPAGWPEGSWCESLEEVVRATVFSRLLGIDRDELLADPRAAGWKSAGAVESALAAAGLRLAAVSVRPRLDEDLRSTRAIPEIAAATLEAPPVIVLALDGADWQYLDHLMARGVMPELRELASSGARGTLVSEHPALSPLLWNTMMTGVSPLEHGILDFTRFHPSTGTKEPITSDERRVPAIWNMATDGGRSVLVLGLWATWPAEPVRGTLVSDRFFTFLFQEDDPPPGVVWPPWRESRMREILAAVETEVGLGDLRAYLPWLAEEEYRRHETSGNPYGHPISALRRILIETTLYDRIATELMSESLPDLSIVYIQGTDTVGHMFAPYAPPRQAEISETDFERYHRVPETYFRSIDDLIGRYHELAKSGGARLVLASDHGFQWFEGRPTELSSFAQATAAKWHRDDGIFLIAGAGVEPASGLRGGIRQLCATMLALSGLPIAENIERIPLPGTPPGERRIADYGRHYEPAAPVLSTAGSADEEMAKLRALGYIGAGESVRSASTEGGTRTAGSYNNEGLILRDERRLEEAIVAFEKAIEIDPNLASALWNLSDMMFAASEVERADELLTRAFANGLPEGRKYLIGRAIGYQRSGSPERSLALLEAAVEAKPDDAELRMFRGRYRIEQGDCRGALEDFRAAQRIDARDPIAFASAGLAARCLGDEAEAQRHFRRALELDPNQPQLRRMLGQR
ncbi:MAG TPA: alkaline phosphatase family protein [Thermoanaerobaculia bacterium]|nr:alkaline phosphatase family protein [Thermoanaerobaculia bacterium]